MKKRHFLKAISYRIIGTLTTTITGWVVTGNLTSGLKIGAIESIIKIGIYYGHERLWYLSKYGVKK